MHTRCTIVFAGHTYATNCDDSVTTAITGLNVAWRDSCYTAHMHHAPLPVVRSQHNTGTTVPGVSGQTDLEHTSR